MTFDCKFLLLLIVPHSLGRNLSQAANKPFSLSATAIEQTMRIGSETKVRTTLTNITSHAVTFSDTNPDCDYLTDVRDEKGNLAPQTAYRRQLSCKGGLTDARNILVTLKPQESRQGEIDLTRLYELKLPGKYFVQVQRAIPKELGDGTVKSNIVIITVTQ